MEVILLEKIQNLGKLGDKVKVKPGYGRNYLIPRKKAVPATATTSRSSKPSAPNSSACRTPR